MEKNLSNRVHENLKKSQRDETDELDANCNLISQDIDLCGQQDKGIWEWRREENEQDVQVLGQGVEKTVGSGYTKGWRGEAGG